jgi:cardiolipin synthase
MTVPNLITTLRIILAPIFIIYMINGNYFSGLIIFIACGVSDGIDGLIARIFNQKSRLGSYLDPLADKIVLVSAFIALAFIGFLPSWLTVMVISRDILILLGVFVLFLYGQKFKVNPALSSKVTTCLQFITVSVVLAKDYLPFLLFLYNYLYYITAFFTIISFLQYMYYWFKMLGDDQVPD